MGWRARVVVPAGLARAYLGLRVLDVLLLFLGLTGIVLCRPSPWIFAGALAVWAFGVVEFVNYFVVRLAYPARLWFVRVWRWRRPRLVEDFRESL